MCPSYYWLLPERIPRLITLADAVGCRLNAQLKAEEDRHQREQLTAQAQLSAVVRCCLSIAHLRIRAWCALSRY
jgi:hypothetical protein